MRKCFRHCPPDKIGVSCKQDVRFGEPVFNQVHKRLRSVMLCFQRDKRPGVVNTLFHHFRSRLVVPVVVNAQCPGRPFGRIHPCAVFQQVVHGLAVVLVFMGQQASGKLNQIEIECYQQLLERDTALQQKLVSRPVVQQVGIACAAGRDCFNFKHQKSNKTASEGVSPGKPSSWVTGCGMGCCTTGCGCCTTGCITG